MPDTLLNAAAAQSQPLLNDPARALRRAQQAEEFMENDPSGFGLTLVAMGVVLLALLCLYFIFHFIGRLSVRHMAAGKKDRLETSPFRRGDYDGSVAVAIALALHQYAEEARDEEEGYVTIQEVSRRYSPWSAKSFGVMNNQRARR
ncbi:MAG: hypothetical protein CSA07_03510 [Bacteroidia bacterium]|nr:MAG: hypothetical protein CSA07_03510 [Bacteroidia bacterium]